MYRINFKVIENCAKTLIENPAFPMRFTSKRSLVNFTNYTRYYNHQRKLRNVIGGAAVIGAVLGLAYYKSKF